MASLYTIDASVFINAFNPYEAGHKASYRLLSMLREQSAPIILPTLLIPEVAAAISRGREDAELARRFVLALSRLPHLMFIPLNATLAHHAAEMATQHRLRGSDAVYTAVGQRFGSLLITLDREHRDRISGVLTVRTPAEELAELAT